MRERERERVVALVCSVEEGNGGVEGFQFGEKVLGVRERYQTLLFHRTSTDLLPHNTAFFFVTHTVTSTLQM